MPERTPGYDENMPIDEMATRQLQLDEVMSVVADRRIMDVPASADVREYQDGQYAETDRVFADIRRKTLERVANRAAADVDDEHGRILHQAALVAAEADDQEFDEETGRMFNRAYWNQVSALEGYQAARAAETEGRGQAVDSEYSAAHDAFAVGIRAITGENPVVPRQRQENTIHFSHATDEVLAVNYLGQKGTDELNKRMGTADEVDAAMNRFIEISEQPDQKTEKRRLADRLRENKAGRAVVGLVGRMRGWRNAEQEFSNEGLAPLQELSGTPTIHVEEEAVSVAATVQPEAVTPIEYDPYGDGYQAGLPEVAPAPRYEYTYEERLAELYAKKAGYDPYAHKDLNRAAYNLRRNRPFGRMYTEDNNVPDETAQSVSSTDTETEAFSVRMRERSGLLVERYDAWMQAGYYPNYAQEAVVKGLRAIREDDTDAFNAIVDYLETYGPYPVDEAVPDDMTERPNLVIVHDTHEEVADDQGKAVAEPLFESTFNDLELQRAIRRAERRNNRKLGAMGIGAAAVLAGAVFVGTIRNGVADGESAEPVRASSTSTVVETPDVERAAKPDAPAELSPEVKAWLNTPGAVEKLNTGMKAVEDETGISRDDWQNFGPKFDEAVAFAAYQVSQNPEQNPQR